MEKTISLRAKDTGVSSVIERLRKSSQELSKGMIRDAVDYGRITKETTSTLEEQIRVLEQSQKLHVEISKMKAAEKLQQRLSSAKTGIDRAEVINDYKTHVRGLGKAAGEDTMQIKLLRELIDTIKATAKEEIREDKKGVKKRVRAFSKGKLNMDDMTEEEQLKVAYQQEILDKETPDRRGGWGQTIVGGAVGGAVVSASQRLGQMAQAQTGESMVASMLSAIPIFGGVAADLKQKYIIERTAYEQGKNKRRAITGREGNFDWSTDYGYKSAEVSDLAGQTARAYGSRHLFSRRTENIVALERGYGIDRATSLSGAELSRFGGKGASGDVVTLVNAMRGIGLMGKGADMTRLQDLIKFQNSLAQDQLTRLTSIDSSANAQLVVTAQKIGGVFAYDPKLMNQVNQGLISPQNEYQQAMSFTTLSKMNPNGSYWDLLKMKEGGTATPGYAYNRMKAIQKRYGYGQEGMIAAKQAFGLSANQTELLMSNVDAWKNTGLEEGFKQFKTSDIQEKGRLLTSKKDRQVAEAEEKFARGAIKGTISIFKQAIKEFTDAVTDSTTKINNEKNSDKT